MHTVGAQVADVHYCVLGRFKLQSQAVLDSVRLFVVLGKARDGRGSLETGHRTGWIVRVTSPNQVIERLLHGATWTLAAGKSPQLGHRVQIVFLRPELGLSAARRLLTSQQRRGDNT